MPVTEFQERVYAALQQIPSGRVTTYALLAKHLSTAPRAIGGALRNNPFAPVVPCHRVIQANGHVGGYMGEAAGAPSGINSVKKRELLEEEGVMFDDDGFVLDREKVWFDGPWARKRRS